MKLLSTLIFTLFLGLMCNPETTLLIDTENKHVQLPRRYRVASDCRASASAQFSQQELEQVATHLQDHHPVIVVDLRQESHGFVDGTPVTWYGKHNAANIGLSLLEIKKKERELLASLQAAKQVTLHTAKPGRDDKDNPRDVAILKALTEAELSKINGLEYLRIPVTDHMKPEVASVDRFVYVTRQMAEKSWLYIHCRGGRGRSSTFMIMRDMMLHAKTLSFDAILEKQYRLGNDDMTYVPEALSWRSFRKIERYEFLKRFYRYCLESDPNFSKLYSEWLYNP